MARFTKAMRTAQFYESMARYGFDYETADRLRRIEMTLHRWAEGECGNGNEYGSWAIERDEDTDKPFRVHHIYGHGKFADRMTRTAIADRESGALRRLDAIMAAHPDLAAYHQADPRGCALYILHKSDLGEFSIDQVYTRGFGVSVG